MNDQQLERQAAQLGREASREIDPERVAERVLERLRREPHSRPGWWRRPGWLRIAAAVMLVVVGGVVTRSVMNQDQTAVGDLAVLPELEVLTDGELVQVLDSLILDVSNYEVVMPGLEDLNETELQTLLEEFMDD